MYGQANVTNEIFLELLDTTNWMNPCPNPWLVNNRSIYKRKKDTFHKVHATPMS